MAKITVTRGDGLRLQCRVMPVQRTMLGDSGDLVSLSTSAP